MSDGPAYRTPTCGGCGAPVEIAAAAGDFRCDYCGVLNQRENPPPDPKRPRAAVTFVSVQHTLHQQRTITVDSTDRLTVRLRDLTPTSVLGLVLRVLLIAVPFALAGWMVSIVLDAPWPALTVVLGLPGMILGIRWAVLHSQRIARRGPSAGTGEER